MTGDYYDVYDLGDKLWALWRQGQGYVTEFMNEQAYQKWWAVHMGVVGRRLPSAHTLYRADVDEKGGRIKSE